jgi:hypothetical protein
MIDAGLEAVQSDGIEPKVLVRPTNSQTRQSGTALSLTAPGATTHHGSCTGGRSGRCPTACALAATCTSARWRPRCRTVPPPSPSAPPTSSTSSTPRAPPGHPRSVNRWAARLVCAWGRGLIGPGPACLQGIVRDNGGHAVALKWRCGWDWIGKGALVADKLATWGVMAWQHAVHLRYPPGGGVLRRQ